MGKLDRNVLRSDVFRQGLQANEVVTFNIHFQVVGPAVAFENSAKREAMNADRTVEDGSAAASSNRLGERTPLVIVRSNPEVAFAFLFGNANIQHGQAP